MGKHAAIKVDENPVQRQPLRLVDRYRIGKPQRDLFERANHLA